jgi:hypothetical protein
MSRAKRAPNESGRARRHAAGAGALAGLLAGVLSCTSAPARSPDDEQSDSETAAPAAEPSTAAPAPSAPPAAVGAGAAADSPSAAAPVSAGSDLDQDIANIEKMAGIAPGAPEAPSGREIIYRVASGELTVDLGGLTLKPKAKAVKRANGSYGVELEVVAESKDGQQYWISSPSNRPLSIAGEVLLRAEETQRFGDERKGEGELTVGSRALRTFRQSWPAKGQPKIWGGQKATLEVGLWGVRGEDERERPVKRLFIVKLSASARPTALIMPPDVVGSE